MRANYSRRAVVGQYTGIVDGRLTDFSERVNYDRSKKYPHSSTRQQEREKRRHAKTMK